MVLLRGLIHLAALVALAAISVAVGRWLSDPTGVAEALALFVTVVLVAASLARLYGSSGPVSLSPARPRQADPVIREPAAGPAPPLWSEPGPRLDLNLAPADELMSLPGIGRVLATRIVAARPFASLDEVAATVGPARLRALADRVKI